MRLWQRSMIRLARNDAVRTFMQQNRWSSALAGRFVAGKDLAAARRKIEELRQQGVIASIYYLGEYVTSQDLVEQNVRRIIDVIESTGPAESSAFLSIDPTQIGYSISEETGRSNALRIGHAFVGRKSMRFIMIDMEDSSYVARSIALYHTLMEEGIPVAITLQAYLHRTEEDVQRLGRRGAAIRLCKGAFIESRDVAWTGKREINGAYLRMLRMLLAPEMKAAGAYPIIATHDERTIREIIPGLKRDGWRPQQYEFEMLLGVREDLQRQLAREGHVVRVYVPFGSEWWPYTIRRVGENPAMAAFILRALLRKSESAAGRS